MKPLIIENYIVHFSFPYSTTIQFDVYPIVEWENFHTKESGIFYYDKDSSDTHEQLDENCSHKLTGTYCWRGVWEGRLYFPDEEYWIEELEELSEIVNKHIIPVCQNYIKLKDPHNYYE